MVHAAYRPQALDDAYKTLRMAKRLGSVFVNNID
jgi:hypothetical protein